MSNIGSLITIGMPFLNVAEFIDYAIRSVINQSYKNWELILTDDGSTDGTVDIVKSYLFDSRIKLIEDKERKGLVFRLNQQISLAKGLYFARMDADDIMHPGRLAYQVGYLENNPHIDVVGSYAYSIDAKNSIYGLLTPNIIPCTLNDVFNHRCFIHPSVMARTNWYKNNLYNPEQVRMEDTGLWARTILKYNFVNLDVPLMFYRNVGIPVLKKYLQSMKGERKLIRSTLLGHINLLRCKLILMTYLKSFVYMFFSFIRKEDVLVRRRASGFDSSEMLNASEILRKSCKCNCGRQ